jgi:hypothetical protein
MLHVVVNMSTVFNFSHFFFSDYEDEVHQQSFDDASNDTNDTISFETPAPTRGRGRGRGRGENMLMYRFENVTVVDVIP